MAILGLVGGGIFGIAGFVEIHKLCMTFVFILGGYGAYDYVY